VVLCVVVYLLVDVRRAIRSDDTVDVLVHHGESLVGLGLSLWGYNVGVLNNCVLSEYSTLWLAVAHFAKLSTNGLVRTCVQPVSLGLFVVTFIAYRIVPCLTMLRLIAVADRRADAFDPVHAVHVAEGAPALGPWPAEMLGKLCAEVVRDVAAALVSR